MLLFPFSLSHNISFFSWHTYQNTFESLKHTCTRVHNIACCWIFWLTYMCLLSVHFSGVFSSRRRGAHLEFLYCVYHNVCIIKLYMRVYWTMLDIWNVLSLLLLYIWQLHSTMVIFNPLDTDDTINCSLSFHQSLCMR